MGLFLRMLLGYQAWYRHRNHSDAVSPSIVPIIIGLVFLDAINLIFIMDIEFTLRQNRLQEVSGESAWTFDRILAMILLVLPLRDLMETISERRETVGKDQHTATLRIAIRDEATMKAILALIEKDGDVMVPVT
ncbi:hypothetical protein B0H13DRAFT_1921236 [Mycena leptocephala]|nr:hypothetical protein B0H13DRAFT_1921236 [Mycena leptocephala]